MWVKICANTNLEDALLAAELGADAVGFVFAPSSRQVTPDQVAAITRHLPDNLETVGVFPAWDAARIGEAAQQAGVSTIQLHGGPVLELASQLHARFDGKIGILPVLHWTVGADRGQAVDLLAQAAELGRIPAVRRVLVDSQVGPASGGTGIAFDWSAAQPLFSAPSKFVLAGGLNPGNVGEAIQQLKPWGVDVASGVEASPGKKNRPKLASFLKAVRQLEAPPQD